MLRRVLSSGTNEHDTSSTSTYVYHPVEWIKYVFNTFSRPSHWMRGLTGDRCIDGWTYSTIGVRYVCRLAHHEAVNTILKSVNKKTVYRLLPLHGI